MPQILLLLRRLHWPPQVQPVFIPVSRHFFAFSWLDIAFIFSEALQLSFLSARQPPATPPLMHYTHADTTVISSDDY